MSVRGHTRRSGPIGRWALVWLVLSTLIIEWDISFLLLRPWSLPGKSLGFLWAPYTTYLSVNLSYGDLNDSFVMTHAMMSAIEVLIAVLALMLYASKRYHVATLLIFSTSLLTCAKTLLILLLECFSGFPHTGHTSLEMWLLVYFLPNVIWVVMPALVAAHTARILLRQTSTTPRFIVTEHAKPESPTRPVAIEIPSPPKFLTRS